MLASKQLVCDPHPWRHRLDFIDDQTRGNGKNDGAKAIRVIIQAGARDAGRRERPAVEEPNVTCFLAAVGGYRHPNRFLLGALL